MRGTFELAVLECTIEVTHDVDVSGGRHRRIVSVDCRHGHLGLARASAV
jgi:hypothetical protein